MDALNIFSTGISPTRHNGSKQFVLGKGRAFGINNVLFSNASFIVIFDQIPASLEEPKT